jgi:hypothetical protein
VRCEILSGWKDIANYLGRGVRTVQRYELELGLPVHRPSGKSQGSVMATRAELDTWIASCRLLNRPQYSTASSVLLACRTLKDRVAQMDQLVERIRNLQSEILASRERLLATIRRIHKE